MFYNDNIRCKSAIGKKKLIQCSLNMDEVDFRVSDKHLDGRKVATPKLYYKYANCNELCTCYQLE